MIKKVIRFLGVALLCMGCASEESAELARMDDALKNKGGYESYFLDKVQALKEVLTEAQQLQICVFHLSRQYVLNPL